MSPHPLRLLLCGYGAAVALAAAAWSHGLASAVVALLGAWIGGAVACLALASMPLLGRAFRSGAADGADAAADAALSDALRRWEEDADVDAAARREDRRRA